MLAKSWQLLLQNFFGTLMVSIAHWRLAAMVSLICLTNFLDTINLNAKSIENMQSSVLKNHSGLLFRICGTAYVKSAAWKSVRENLLRMADNVRKHTLYLDGQNEEISGRPQKLTRTDEYEWEIYNPKTIDNPTLQDTEMLI